MMKNKNIGIGVILLVVGLFGVILTPPMHHSMMSIVQEMSGIQIPQGIAKSALPDEHSNEAALLIRYCTQCHALPGPGMHTRDEWPLVMSRMAQYLNTMHALHIDKPSDVELDIILGYLQKHAQLAMNKSQYDDLNTPAGILFEQTCSRCHALPDPKQFSKAEWPFIVQRMRKNMRNMNKSIPNDSDLEQITQYLQQHAGES